MTQELINLENLRRILDNLDSQWAVILSNRLSYAADIGCYKRDNGLPLEDKEREEEVIETRNHLIEGRGLDLGLPREVMGFIVDHTYQLEKKAYESGQQTTLTLDQSRRIIDGFDSLLISTIAVRMGYIPDVAKWKQEHSIPRVDEDREQEKIDSIRKQAEGLKFSPDLAENMMKTIIKYAHEIEKKYIP